MNHYPVTPSCFADHMGPWAIRPDRMVADHASIRAGTFGRIRAEATPGDASTSLGVQNVDGLAVIPLNGPLMKGWSKFGGTSTVAVRRALRAAVADERVSKVLLRIDSPGGHVAGTDDLARDVAAVNEKKPVIAFCEDLCASAAYWVASQAREIVATPTTFVGSIGVFTVLYDESKAAEIAGVKVHVLATGPHKAVGVPGAEVTGEQKAVLQAEIDVLGEHFFRAVGKGRGLSGKALDAVTDGRVWVASEAKALGLVDRVASFDETVERLAAAPRRARAALEIEQARAEFGDRRSA